MQLIEVVLVVVMAVLRCIGALEFGQYGNEEFRSAVRW